MLECQSCSLSVHAECYAVPTKQPFYCHSCLFHQGKTDLVCSLCTYTSPSQPPQAFHPLRVRTTDNDSKSLWKARLFCHSLCGYGLVSSGNVWGVDKEGRTAEEREDETEESEEDSDSDEGEMELRGEGGELISPSPAPLRSTPSTDSDSNEGSEGGDGGDDGHIYGFEIGSPS